MVRYELANQRTIGTYGGRLAEIEFKDGRKVEGRLVTKRELGEVGVWSERVFLDEGEIGQVDYIRTEIKYDDVVEFYFDNGVERETDDENRARSLRRFCRVEGIGV